MDANYSIPLIYDHTSEECVLCEGGSDIPAEDQFVDFQPVKKSKTFKKARRRTQKPLPEALISDRKVAKALKNDLGRTCFKDTLKLALSAEDRGVWGGLTYTPPEAELLIQTLGTFNEKTSIALELPFWATFQLAAQYMAEKHSHIAIPGSSQTVALCLYTVVLATSGESKTWSLGRVMSCIEAATGWQPETIEEPASTAFFIQALKEKEGKPILMCIDEIGPFWDALKKSEAHAETKRLLLKLYDVPKTIERGTMKYRLTIKRPHFSMLGTGVYETFSECMEPADWESGMAARIGFIKAKSTAGSGRRDPFFLSIDEGSIKRAWVEQMEVPVHEIYRLNAPAAARLEEMWDHYKDEVQISKAFARRVLFRIFKYAAVYHWLCKKVTDILDERDMDWAIRLGQTHIADLQFILEDSKLKDYRRLLKIAEDLKARMVANGQEFNARQLYMRNRHLLKSMADANIIIECMHDEANVDTSPGGAFDQEPGDEVIPPKARKDRNKGKADTEGLDDILIATTPHREPIQQVQQGNSTTKLPEVYEEREIQAPVPSTDPFERALAGIADHLSPQEALGEAFEWAVDMEQRILGPESIIIHLALRFDERALWRALREVESGYRILARTNFVFRAGDDFLEKSPAAAIKKVEMLAVAVDPESFKEDVCSLAGDFWPSEDDLAPAFNLRMREKFPIVFAGLN